MPRTRPKKRQPAKQPRLDVESRTIKLAGGASLLLGLLLIGAISIEAATDRYKFVARGTVTVVNSEQKSLTVSITHITGKGESDLKGKTQTFKGSAAKVFKTGADGKDKRIKITNVAVGDEVLMKGVAKSDDTFVLTFVKVNIRSFELVGTLKEHNQTLKRLTITVKTSSYKPTVYKNKDVVVKYSGSTKFSSGGRDINADEVVKGDHKVKVSGKIVGNEWEADKFIDNYVEK